MICTKCKKDLPLYEFSPRKDSTSGYRGVCKSCSRQSRAVWKSKTNYKEKAAAYNKLYNKRPEVKERLTKYNKERSDIYLARRREVKARYTAMLRKHLKSFNTKSDISLEKYTELLSKSCFYCLADLDDQVGICLDRLDNTKGYIKGNVVPCCKYCNRFRSNKVSADEMRKIVLFLQSSRDTLDIWNDRDSPNQLPKIGV